MPCRRGCAEWRAQYDRHACGAPVRLPTLSELQTLASESALINFSLTRPGERKPERFKLEDDFWRKATHVLDRILVAKPVSSLHSVVCVPAPVVLGHVGQSSIDSALRGHCVGPSGENLGDTSRFQSMFHKTCSRPETSAASPNHDSVVSVVMNLVTSNLGRRNSSRSPRSVTTTGAGHRAAQAAQHVSRNLREETGSVQPENSQKWKKDLSRKRHC